MTKAVLMALLLSMGLFTPAAAAPRYPGDRGPGGIWNDGPYACRLGQSCNCHPDTYVAIRCEGTPYGPRCWWNNNCYCEPPRGSQYCGNRSGDWPAFRKRPTHWCRWIKADRWFYWYDPPKYRAASIRFRAQSEYELMRCTCPLL